MAREGLLEIDIALLGDDDDRPEHVGQLVLEVGLHVIDLPDALTGLNELRQVSDVAGESKSDVPERPLRPYASRSAAS